MSDVIEELRQLLPKLEYARQTHVEWRDCDQRYRDENPGIGGPEFHSECVSEYDERIAVINSAIVEIGEWREIAREILDGDPDCTCIEPHEYPDHPTGAECAICKMRRLLPTKGAHSCGRFQTGDRGQRFEVTYYDPGDDQRKVFGWTDDAEGARRMCDSVEKHPEWEWAQLRDRTAPGEELSEQGRAWLKVPNDVATSPHDSSALQFEPSAEIFRDPHGNTWTLAQLSASRPAQRIRKWVRDNAAGYEGGPAMPHEG